MCSMLDHMKVRSTRSNAFSKSRKRKAPGSETLLAYPPRTDKIIVWDNVSVGMSVGNWDTIELQLLDMQSPRPHQRPGGHLPPVYDHSARQTGRHGAMVAAPPWRHCQMSGNDSLLASGSATIVTRPTRHSATGAPSRRTMGGILRPFALYGRDTHHVLFVLGSKIVRV